MDNTFQSGVGLPAEEGAHDSQCRRQQLRTLMQREMVSSNSANMQRGSMSFSTTQSAESGLQVSVPHLECKNHNEGETATLHSKGFPPTTPPVSRTRLPPSCPTLHHPVPSPPSTTCPPNGRWTPSTTSTTSSISGSQSYFEARAVFCQENQSLPQTWTPSCTSTLPRPWGEPARGRPRLQTSFMGRSPSGHRSSHSEHQQSLPNGKPQQGLGSDVTPFTSEG